MNWERLARADTHPLRVSILEVLGIDSGRTLSPKDLSLELQAPLSTVNYHVTELRRSGLVEIVEEHQVRARNRALLPRRRQRQKRTAEREGQGRTALAGLTGGTGWPTMSPAPGDRPVAGRHVGDQRHPSELIEELAECHARRCDHLIRIQPHVAEVYADAVLRTTFGDFSTS